MAATLGPAHVQELIETKVIRCPYCDESIELVLDLSAGGQEYVEDCSVCCRPILVQSEISDGRLVSLRVLTDNE